MWTWQAQCHTGGAIHLRTKQPQCQLLVPTAHAVATVALAAKSTAFKMRKWLADPRLLGDDDLTDTKALRCFKIFSSLNVGDCT